MILQNSLLRNSSVHDSKTKQNPSIRESKPELQVSRRCPDQSPGLKLEQNVEVPVEVVQIEQDDVGHQRPDEEVSVFHRQPLT